MNRIPVLFAALAFAACGGNSTATDHNRPGTGTSTLLVTGDINASQSSTGPLTSFQVDVRDGLNNKVSGATVTIHNQDLGDVPLVEATAGSGRYVNSKTSFPTGDFTLSVVRNTDNVKDVVVGNPGAHTVNAPAQDSTVPATQPLQLSWTTPTTAKSVSIKTKGFGPAQAPDTGAYTIPGTSNTTQASQHLDLSRFNEVDIAGGLSGSRLRVTYTAGVDYAVQ